MINVLQIVKRYAGNYPLVNEMCRLEPERFRVVVCYLCGEDDGRNGVEEIAAATYYLNFRSRQLRWRNRRLLRQLVSIIEKESIDVVNCHLQRTMTFGVRASRRAANRPAVISTLHGLGSADFWGRKMLNLLFYPRLFRIVGVSAAVCEDVRKANWGLPAGKVVVIPNGLDFSPYLGGGDRLEIRRKVIPGIEAKCLFGAVGRLSEVKNHRLLLQAFRKVVDREPGCALVIAGRGELEKELRELSGSLDLRGHVAFLGFRKDVPEILKSLDAFVLPSLREGMPLSLLEAMASGLPVIASAVGGIPEIFGQADIGRMIDPLDESKLAEAMIGLALMDEGHRRRLGENARSRAIGHFSADRMQRLYQEVYEAAVLPKKKIGLSDTFGRVVKGE